MESRLGYNKHLVALARPGVLMSVVGGRSLALLLTAVIVFSLLPPPASAAPVIGDGYAWCTFSDALCITSSSNVTVSGGDITLSLESSETAFSDSFETDLTKWDGNGGTDWYRDTDQKSDGSWSVKADSGDEGDLKSDNIDLSGAYSADLDFWYRLDDPEASDFILYFYNGSGYGSISELGGGSEDTWLNYDNVSIDLGTYGVANFHIRLDADVEYPVLGSEEKVWVDQLVLTTTSYIASGTVTSATLAPGDLTNWDTVSWDDTEPAGTDLKIRLEYYTGSDWELIPDEDLSGNAAGFDSSPVSLMGLDINTYTQVRIVASLSTTDTSVTPTLSDWYVSWKGWKDGIIRWEKVGASSGVTFSGTQAALATSGTVTPFSDSFETDLTKWDGNGGTDWFLSTDQEHDGSQSVKANSGDEGALKSDDIDLSSALTANLNFWFRKVATDAGDDFLLYFWNGSSYDLIDDLDDNGGDSTWISWDNSIDLGTYGVSDFHIYFLADVEWPILGTEERCWVDQLALTVTEPQSGSLTSTAITPSGTYEWNTFTASHDLPSNTDIDYNVLDASDDSTLCTITAAQAAAGYDVSSCVGATSSVKVYAEMSTTDGVDTPTLEDWHISWEPQYTPSVNAPIVWDTAGTPSAVTSMTPQVQYNAKVLITDNNTLDDLNTVKVTIFYDSDGAYSSEDVPATGNTQTAAILTWTNGGSPAWTVNPGSNTSWTIESDNCVAPLLTGTSGNFEFHFKPGKVATETTGSAKWHIYSEADDGTATGDNYSANMDMNWYGEVAGITSTTSFGTVGLGSEATISGTVSATFISNGAYDEQVKSEASWTGQTSAATLSLYIAGTDPGTAQFAMLADDDGTQDGAVQVLSAGYASIDDIGTQTGESGDTASNNHLWLWLGGVGIPDEEYQGAVYYKIADGS